MSDGPDEVGHGKTSVSGQTQPAVQGVEALEHPPVVGRFTLERLLGRGGMASVYLAREAGTHQDVAVKLMDPSLKKSPDFVQRFLNEAQATSSLRHPNIVETLDHGEVDGWYFIATEYVDGGNLAQLVRDMKGLSPALAAELVTQLLAGLTHAHEKGIVHRDLKPENLLLTAGGILKVGDFGIARSADTTHQLTQTGMLIGTVGYMSPEQAQGLKLDARSDLFAVGIILYEMLTGTNPFASDNPATSITRILTNAHPPLFDVKPAAPAELDQMLDRLLQIDPSARFASAKEAHDHLLGFVSERRSTQPTLVAECLRRPQEMKRLLDQQAAAALVAEARNLAGGNSLEQNHAAVKLQYALHYEPENAEAKELLGRFKQLSTGPTKNPKILDLEKYLEKYPDTPQALQQVAQLYKMENNLLQAAVYLKRYLRQRPTDSYSWGQLFQLTGERPGRGGSSRVGPATRDGPGHAKTGGFVAPALSPPRDGGTGMLPGLAGVEPPMPPLPAPLPGAPVTAPPSRPPAPGKAGTPAPGWAIGIGVAVAVVGVALGGYRKISGDIARAAKEQQAAADALARQQALLEKQVAEERARAELATRAGEAERLANQLVEDGLRELTAERYSPAVAGFSEVLEKYPDQAAADRALFFRGKAQLALDKKTDAIKDLTAFLERRPTSPDAPEALLRRGQAYTRNLLLDDALADLDAFFSRHPGHELTPEVQLARAEVYVLRERFDDARADLDLVLSGGARQQWKDAARALSEKLPAPKEKKN